MFGLCDCNNFFVSCERVFDPSLNGRPVLVLSSNDGCVIARSEESKALGIKMGVPLFQIKDIVRRNDVVLFSSNFELYGDMSHRVFESLRQYIELVEVYSIDEAFLDLSGMNLETLQAWGQQLAKTVKKGVGIPVSIGIAPSKTLAKIASKLCKKYPKLQGCCLMYRPEDITKVLSKLPVGEVWGIGRRQTKKLNEVNVFTAEQFRNLPPEWVQKNMSIVGLRTWKELHSEPCIELEHKVADRKSICVSRSFASEIYEFEALSEAVVGFLSKACEKLRKQKSVARSVQVFAWTNRFREDSPQQYGNKFIQFPVPTDSTLEMLKSVTQGLKDIFIQGHGYKKAGVVLYGIEDSSSDGGAVQGSLFDGFIENEYGSTSTGDKFMAKGIGNETRLKHEAIMKAVDDLNKAMGRDAVSLGGSSSISYTNREFLSRRFTTDWDEILEVKV